jgi:cathepsin B
MANLTLFVLSIAHLVVTAPLADEAVSLIEQVNAANVGWTAAVNTRFTDEGLAKAGSLMGSRYPSDGFELPKKITPVNVQLPSFWDSTLQFPQCPSIGDIWDQSACASCYVIATVMSAADRVCIATNGTFTARLSAEQMVGCCKTCGNGCAEGFPAYAWAWMSSHGIVTGGPYGDFDYCSSYSLAPCEHHSKGQFPSCGSPAKTPICPTKCDANTSWPAPFDQDRVKFKQAYQVGSDDASIQNEIMQHGSVTAQMNVYSDFLHYKGGVYQAVGGEDLGGHAVRIYGFGEESGKPFWLVANSWNRDWGVNGTFKILRGNCGINLGVYGGEY